MSELFFSFSDVRFQGCPEDTTLHLCVQTVSCHPHYTRYAGLFFHVKPSKYPKIQTYILVLLFAHVPKAKDFLVSVARSLEVPESQISKVVKEWNEEVSMPFDPFCD